MWGLVLLCLCYIGYFKGTALVRSLPIDATLLFALATCAGLAAHVLGRRTTTKRALVPIVGLWAVFGVGVTLTIGSQRGFDKVALLGTVTLLCALAPSCFLYSSRSQRWWLGGVLCLAGVMAAAVILAPDLVAQQDFGRLQLEGGANIGSSRVIGAGIMVAAVFGLSAGRRRWLWIGLATGGTIILIAIGSRGPFLALVMALALVLVLGRAFKGVRGPYAVVFAVGLIGTVWGLTVSSSRAAGRILGVLTGDQVDVAREFLLQQAWAGILTHPLGVGWGGFGTIGQVDRAYGGSPIYPHNIVLEITVEGGWIAGIAFLAVVLISVIGYVRASGTPETAALLGLGVYWLLVAQTSSDVNGNRTTWASISIGLVLYANGQRKRRQARLRQDPESVPAPSAAGSGRSPRSVT